MGLDILAWAIGVVLGTGIMTGLRAIHRTRREVVQIRKVLEAQEARQKHELNRALADLDKSIYEARKTLYAAEARKRKMQATAWVRCEGCYQPHEVNSAILLRHERARVKGAQSGMSPWEISELIREIDRPAFKSIGDYSIQYNDRGPLDFEKAIKALEQVPRIILPSERQQCSYCGTTHALGEQCAKRDTLPHLDGKPYVEDGMKDTQHQAFPARNVTGPPRITRRP